MEEKLSKRKEELEAEFAEVKNKRELVIDQGRQLQQQLNVLNERLTQLQGAYMELQSLLGEEPVAPEVEEKKVEKKEEKKK